MLQNDLVGHFIAQDGQLVVKDHGDVDDLIDLLSSRDDPNRNHPLLEKGTVWCNPLTLCWRQNSKTAGDLTNPAVPFSVLSGSDRLPTIKLGRDQDFPHLFHNHIIH